MRIVCFSEGPRPRSGGMGLVAVPKIDQSLANRGHRVVTFVAGDSYQAAEPLGHTSTMAMLPERERGSAPSYEEITCRAYGRWAFAPTLFSRSQPAVRDADFLLLHSLYSFPVLAGYCLARLRRKPYGVYLHDVLAPFQRSVSRGKKMVYNLLAAKRILNGASFLVYSAVGEREETAALQIKAPSIITPLGIDVSQYYRLPRRGQFRARYVDGHQGPLVLYLGRLNAKKGLDILVEAVALVAGQMPDVRLAIVGSGDPPAFADQVKKWVRRFRIEDRTVMTGVLRGEGKLAALADADVLALPSVAESFAMTLFEAMASSLPVVISADLNYAGEVEQWGAGLVVRRDPGEFAAAILKLLGDEGLRRRIGEKGRLLSQSYAWDSSSERLEKAINCVLQGIPLSPELTQL